MPLLHTGACEQGCGFGSGGNCNNVPNVLNDTICSTGLTYPGFQEACYDGMSILTRCNAKGVCQYRADGIPDYIPTTGGTGGDVRIAAANTTFPSHSNPPYNYSEALAKLLIYFDSMISGNLTGSCKRRLTWRSDSCFSCIGKYGEDLSGGFYEAGGSTLKFVSIVSGFSGTMMAWAGLEYGAAMVATGVMEDLKWKVKWAADHVINAHPQPLVFAGFLGNSTDDFDYLGPVEYYEQYAPPRPIAYITPNNRATEMLADGAATLAAAALLLSQDDPAWASNALVHAAQLYDFGKTYQGSYANSNDPLLNMVSDSYPSNNGYFDDLAWAATWMYKATNNQTYLDDAKTFLSKAPKMYGGVTFETGYKTPGVAILLSGVDTNDTNALAMSKTYFDAYLTMQVPHTLGGAAYPYHWSSNRHAANLGFLTMVHAKNPAVDSAYAARLVNYGMHQTNYLLGSAGRSWVVGFGTGYPQYIHHKMSLNSILTWNGNSSAEPLAPRIWMTSSGGFWAPMHADGYIQKAKFDFDGSWRTQQHISWGLLFGGVLYNDGLVNTRRDYTYAEPTIETNAGAVGAVAALADWYSTGLYTGVPSLDGVIEPPTCSPPVLPTTFDTVASPPPPPLAPSSVSPVALPPSPSSSSSPTPSSSSSPTPLASPNQVPATSSARHRFQTSPLSALLFILFLCGGLVIIV